MRLVKVKKLRFGVGDARRGIRRGRSRRSHRGGRKIACGGGRVDGGGILRKGGPAGTQLEFLGIGWLGGHVDCFESEKRVADGSTESEGRRAG